LLVAVRAVRGERCKDRAHVIPITTQAVQQRSCRRKHPQGCIATLQGWNNITIELWTHERDGLSENDFIVAAKLDQLLTTPDVQQLLSKKQPEL
jgi:pterin-4a-carbinolamine dehydratase